MMIPSPEHAFASFFNALGWAFIFIGYALLVMLASVPVLAAVHLVGPVVMQAAKAIRRWVVGMCILGLTSCLGCAASPFVEPQLSRWNPVVADAHTWDPCPNYAPYFHGRDAQGAPDCTTRPLDFNFYDVDQLELP